MAGVSVRSQNRVADPEMAAWLDDMRSRFGATLTRVEILALDEPQANATDGQATTLHGD